MAAEIYTNRTYLSSYINKTYNCTFKSLLTQLRLEEAKILLSNAKKYPIAEVAAKSGFSSSESFIHVFKKTTGLTPAKWRMVNMGKNYTSSFEIK